METERKGQQCPSFFYSSLFWYDGTVTSAQVIMDKFSGRSKGFGFVEMSTEEETQAAIDMWNEQELMGRAIFVNILQALDLSKNAK